MNAWRIEKQKRLKTAAAGEGARISGGRWNSAGRPMVYASEHVSLAVLEVLVHSPAAEQREVARSLAELTLRDTMIETLSARSLPADFHYGTPLGVTQAIGDEWLKANRSVGLLVPSAIIPIERNLLLNPLHPDYARCDWGAFAPIKLDPRLWSVRPKHS